ncbi:hypothetical protein C8J56DRAFT_1050791 [Mycena floridula]|nr:hypothetical protein C8J56DRAFT_1050791 [Mycena floridula]
MSICKIAYHFIGACKNCLHSHCKKPAACLRFWPPGGDMENITALTICVICGCVAAGHIDNSKINSPFNQLVLRGCLTADSDGHVCKEYCREWCSEVPPNKVTPEMLCLVCLCPASSHVESGL